MSKRRPSFVVTISVSALAMTACSGSTPPEPIVVTPTAEPTTEAPPGATSTPSASPSAAASVAVPSATASALTAPPPRPKPRYLIVVNGKEYDQQTRTSRPIVSDGAGGCLVEGDFEEGAMIAPGKRPPMRKAKSCPSFMKNPVWAQCTQGIMRANDDFTQCVCEFRGNPPPPPTKLECPRPTPMANRHFARDAFRKWLNPRHSNGREITVNNGRCYVTVPFAKPPRSWRPSPTRQVRCPPLMKDPAWKHCEGGKMRANADMSSCICSRSGNPPGPGVWVACPKKK